jgi:ubiquinol-cytochrome c reductase core subunit 2
MAAAASGSFQYETGEHSGVKFASRDLPGATTTLSVVAKAGTRYQPYPGFADALEKFAFKVHPHHPLERGVY